MPGIILLDLNMPKMDGREALAEIKRDPALRRIPVVVLTTSRAEEDILRTYELGVNSFITKPVTFAGLVEVMRGSPATGSRSSSSRRVRRRAAMAAREPISVLLVEDDEDDFVLARDMLGEQSRTRVRARVGAELRARAAAIRERRHDVYLVDYRLGPTTGLELLREALGSEHARAGDHAHRPGRLRGRPRGRRRSA